MGLFDIFRKKQSDQLTALKVGDWVTQYSTGYWMVVEIFPKYADEDYSYNGVSWKKGDRISDWVILKKGFTSKMKPSNACEFVDAKNCQLLPFNVVKAIETAFTENPKAKEKFDKSPSKPNPSVYSVLLNLSNEQAEAFSNSMSRLPERFTLEDFWSSCIDYRRYVVKPPNATHVLYLYSYLWEINNNMEPFHFNPELKKYDV